MRVDAFDFDLPEDRIALRPISPRDHARLLVVEPHATPQFGERRVADLPDLLAAGDALVVNDTRVLPARLSGVRIRGAATARIEATLHKREAGGRWWAFARPAKKLQVGETVSFGAPAEGAVCFLGMLEATVVAKREGGDVLLSFATSGPVLEEQIEQYGRMPLPPYISAKRGEDAADANDYQTVFAARPGAVAAPTAGLHFTPELLERLHERGVAVHRVTLHVGAGTYLPVKADDTQVHRMHAEYGRLDAATARALNQVRACGGRVVAVGTTSLRLLESATDPAGVIGAYDDETSIFITPGYRFRAVDALLTNFHLPRSTLFMLVAAFAGLETMHAAYRHAIEHGYRFYSYGDACLLWPQRAEAR